VYDDGTCGVKYVALTDDIIKILCLAVIYILQYQYEFHAFLQKINTELGEFDIGGSTTLYTLHKEFMSIARYATWLLGFNDIRCKEPNSIEVFLKELNMQRANFNRIFYVRINHQSAKFNRIFYVGINHAKS